jgi:hypothetical protein
MARRRAAGSRGARSPSRAAPSRTSRSFSASGGQPDRASARLDPFLVLGRVGAEDAVGVPVELRRVALREARVDAHAVLEHRHLRGVHVLGGSRLRQREPAPHHGRVADAVLQHQPRGVRGVRAHEAAAGPADALHDGGQPRGVAAVHRGHARVVSLEERPLGHELGAHAVVVGGHREQLRP